MEPWIHGSCTELDPVNLSTSTAIRARARGQTSQVGPSRRIVSKHRLLTTDFRRLVVANDHTPASAIRVMPATLLTRTATYESTRTRPGQRGIPCLGSANAQTEVPIFPSSLVHCICGGDAGWFAVAVRLLQCWACPPLVRHHHRCRLPCASSGSIRHAGPPAASHARLAHEGYLDAAAACSAPLLAYRLITDYQEGRPTTRSLQ